MKKYLSFTLILIIFNSVFAQDSKKLLTHDDILKWNRITEKEISNNGNYIAYTIAPWKGDKTLKISDKKGNEVYSAICAQKPEFTYDSELLIFTIKQAEDIIRQLKLKKTKKEDMPEDKLGTYNLKNSTLDTVHNIKSYQLPFEWSGWIAWQSESIKLKDINEDAPKDSTEGKKEKTKKENKKNGYPLTLRNLNTGGLKVFPFVTDYIFAEDIKYIAFISTGDDKEFIAGISLYDLTNDQLTKVISGKGTYKQLVINPSATKLAFLADTTQTIKKIKTYKLYYWTRSGETEKIIDNQNLAFPENWAINETGKLFFSENEKRLFFGTSLKKAEKDTTILEEDIPVVDVWHWNEPILQTQQIINKKKDLKKSYLAVYHIDSEQIIQLEKENHTGITLIDKGNSNYILASSYLPYAVQSMWGGWPRHQDIYLIDIMTGNSKMIKEDLRARPEVSPKGNYLFWYLPQDSSWYTYKIDIGKEFKITEPHLIKAANELNDVPSLPYQYGSAGWLTNDKAILIYDRFDIWKVDPENKLKAQNITKTGRSNKISYRLIDFKNIQNRKRARKLKTKYFEEAIDPNSSLFLTGHNEITRADAYYSLSLKSNSLKALIVGNFYLGEPIKAIDSDVFIYSKENFELFPDLLISEKSFKKSIRLSNANPQQKNYKWGTAELYSWTSLDGKKLEGILCKPANFNPNKKYPMIVNFYSKSSQGLYKHRIPEPHRSTIDYHYYTSKGYIIFNPDIYYKEGYPGEDAYNCIMPGITALINKGFIDEKRIGAQGHSWGGYQVAYLATRTNIFAAIESGAPVVNMFSAYGGIRWNSGLNRSFQYEHGQSRIGKNIWEAPQRYFENSPLFTMDKVQTPILIMHNDADGYVPWYQGIEFFIALRRLKKPAWLLNYSGSDHWPLKVKDKHDFQIRMAQFFDHYLNGKPMPKWMKEGIPAVDKGIKLGYELEKN